MKELTFSIRHTGDLSAGITGYDNVVSVWVRDYPGGEPGEFDEYIRGCLASWFDGAKVMTASGVMDQ